MKSNFKNSVAYPIRFLGVKPGSSALENEKKWIYSGVVEADNKFGFEVKYRGEKKIFSPEQIVAMSLQKMKQVAHSHGVPHNDMVITVPSYFTIEERKGLLDAAKIAQVNVLKLLNESTSSKVQFSRIMFSRVVLWNFQKK
jgi:molecular chaperone DnaK (HSP70)